MVWPKITIVGAGNVGATAAHIAATRDLGDIVLLDIQEGVPQGKALDLITGIDSNIVGTNHYEDTKDSNVVVITAGMPRKPGMSRDDLLKKNVEIIKHVTKQVVKYSPDCILIIVSNPLDVMVYAASTVAKFPKNRIMGMAGVLDSFRFRRFIAKELNVSMENVVATVLGCHGDEMVPLPRLCSVSGVPLSEMMSKEKIDSLISRTQKGGGEIVGLLGTSAWYAPATAAIDMVEAILRDKKKIVPATVFLDGEFGISGIFLGALAKLGRSGVEDVVEFKLLPDEQELLNKSAEHVKKVVEEAKKLL